MTWWKLCNRKYDGGMGFCDLHCFNLATLAKKHWRLLEDPYSLCSTIPREKYYLDKNLLKQKPKSGASFTWKIIMAGLETFESGHIWRVEDGTQKYTVLGKINGSLPHRIWKFKHLELVYYSRK
jgi:hypothetical protein